jgi:hypothetical protein
MLPRWWRSVVGDLWNRRCSELDKGRLPARYFGSNVPGLPPPMAPTLVGSGSQYESKLAQRPVVFPGPESNCGKVEQS